jgi:lipopolysaccharide export system protein LptA
LSREIRLPSLATHCFYFGNTRLAIVSGRKTVLKDSKRTLTTRKIEYDMANGIANYKVPGRTVDEENVLTSKEGFYNTRTKEFTYYKNVKLVNKKYTLTTDTLLYNSITKWSDFNGKTKIVNKDGTVLGTRAGTILNQQNLLFIKGLRSTMKRIRLPLIPLWLMARATTGRAREMW